MGVDPDEDLIAEIDKELDNQPIEHMTTNRMYIKMRMQRLEHLLGTRKQMKCRQVYSASINN